jgi:hypothetical protein
MLKFIIGLLVLLIICVVAGVFRKLRGGRFLPPPQETDGEAEPQSLRELARRRQREKASKPR